jgi:ribosomal protein S18 acetylase RimI-like enzyme
MTTSTATPEPVIRRATTDDAADIARVGRASFLETFAHSCSEKDMQDFLDETYTAEALTKEILNINRCYFVATIGGALVGFSSLCLDSNEPAVEAYPNRVEFQRLYVDSNQHGKGIAKILMETTLDLARGLGKEHIWLGVWEENRKAMRFYEKMGYKVVGEHIFMVGNDKQLDWIAVRAL